jgi:hypothetical protein
MPTRISHFLHSSTVTGSQVLGTAFDTADVHEHDLQSKLPQFQRKGRNYQGIVGGIFLKLTTIGTATKCTIRLCSDPDGDVVLVPDTEAQIVTGVTTSTTGSVAYSVNLPLFQTLDSPGNGSLYLFAKTDAASTAVMAESTITWQE